MIITIDTNILRSAFEKFDQDHLNITNMMGRDGRILGCDGDKEIESEYKRNVGGLLPYRKWYQRLFQQQAIHYQSKYNISEKHQARLRRLQCHEPSDLVFIGVAFHCGKILISEDSDVGKGPKGHEPPHCDALAYLTNEMGLTIWDAREACEQL